jgi:hypothetical protein
MIDRNFTTTITVDQDPAAVFAAICDVRAWWSQEIVGRAAKIGDTFKHHFRDLHRCEIAVKEMVPARKIVWTVLENYFSFTEDTAEWKGTDIVFEIARRGDKTVLTFTHVGLVREFQCYGACTDGWRFYVHDSLRELITTGQGRPNVGEAVTESELSLAD